MPTFPLPSHQHRTTTLALLAATVVLAACSSSSDGLAGSSPSVASTSPATPTTEDATATPTTGHAGVTPTVPASDPATTNAAATTVPPSPLDQYLSGGSLRPATAFDPAKAERETRAHEEAIARCMADEGFEYQPFVQPFQWTMANGGVAIVSVGSGTPTDLPPDQFAAQYGYGLSTRDPSKTAGSDVDPNAAIVDAMSIPERVAYYQALFGAGQSLDDQGRPNGEMPGDPKSCWEKAATEVWGDQPASPATDPVLAAFAPLLQQIAAIDDQVNADPRMVAAKAAWSQCMADAGYPGYTDLNAPQSDVAARARDVMGAAMDPRNADPGKLADLQHFEIAIATADNRCREGFGDTYSQVRYNLETRFVEQHRTELEQYRDAVAAEAG